MVPGGSYHRREVLHPSPPRNRGRRRGSTTESRTVHEDERTGQEATQKRDVGEPGKRRVLPCGFAKNAEMVVVGMGMGHESGEIALPTGGGGRWKDGPKSGKNTKMLLVGPGSASRGWPFEACRRAARLWWRDRVRKHGRRFCYQPAADQSGCPLLALVVMTGGHQERARMPLWRT